MYFTHLLIKHHFRPKVSVSGVARKLRLGAKSQSPPLPLSPLPLPFPSPLLPPLPLPLPCNS